MTPSVNLSDRDKGVVDVLARLVGRVIEQCILMDEAEQTREGRAAIADALEAFANTFDDRRVSAESVVAIYRAAGRLRRGEDP